MPPTSEQRPLSALTAQSITSGRSSNDPSVSDSVSNINSNPKIRRRDDILSSRPSTAGEAIENVSFSEYKNLLVMAQQHFDELRRRLQRSSTKNHLLTEEQQRPTLGNTNKSALKSTINTEKKESRTVKQQEQSNQLLSTLLYLSLMMNKVEEVKSILKQLNIDVYNEWGIILSVLHPPHHHIREQRMQKDLVRRIYERKLHYKRQTQTCEIQLDQQKEDMSKLQAQANSTAQQLSATIANLMGETAALRNQLSSKEHVEKELVEAHSEVEFLRTKSGKAEQLYQQAQAEMSRTIQRHQEDLLEATSNAAKEQQQKSKDEISHLVQCHQEEMKSVSNEAAACQQQSKLFEQQLQQYKADLSELQDQANDTAHKMSASITHLLEESASLRIQLGHKQQVELEISSLKEEVETLSSKLQATTLTYQQSKAENEQMIQIHQQALKEANAKFLSAYDQAANSEAYLWTTKDALALAQEQLALSRSECANSLAHTRDVINMQEKKNEADSEVAKTGSRFTAADADASEKQRTLEKIHDNELAIKLIETSAQSRNVASADEVLEKETIQNLEQVSGSVETNDSISTNIQTNIQRVHDSTSQLDSLSDRAESLVATEENDPQTINLALESFHGPVSNAADGSEIAGFAQDLTDKNLANSAEKLSSNSIDPTEINNKSILSLNESTASSLKDIESENKLVKEQGLPTEIFREADAQKMNRMLDEVHDKVANNNINNHLSSQEATCDKAIKSIEEISSSLEAVEDAAGNVNSASEEVGSINVTTESLIDCALKEIHRQYTNIESDTNHTSCESHRDNCVEASTNIICSLGQETALSASTFERLNGSLDEQLVATRTFKDKEVEQLHSAFDHFKNNAHFSQDPAETMQDNATFKSILNCTDADTCFRSMEEDSVSLANVSPLKVAPTSSEPLNTQAQTSTQELVESSGIEGKVYASNAESTLFVDREFLDAANKFDVADYKAESPNANADADAEGNNFAETSTKNEDVYFAPQELACSTRMGISFDQPSSYLDISMITTCSMQDLAEAENSEEAIEEENESVADREDEAKRVVDNDGSGEETVDDGDASTRQLIDIHATTLVYVGIIQVEAIDSALTKSR